MPALLHSDRGMRFLLSRPTLEWACPRQPSSPKSRCPSASDRSSPSRSTSASRCPPSSPAATSARSSCRPRAGSLRRSATAPSIGWSIGGELHELRTRVVRPYGLESELTVSRHGIITRTGDRRGVARFVLVAGRQPAARRRSRDPRLHARPLDPRRRPAARGRDADARHARRPRGAGRPGRAAAACERARRAHERDAAGGRGARRPRLRRPGPRRRRDRPPALPARLSPSQAQAARRLRARSRSRAARAGCGSRRRSPGRRARRPSSRAS